MSQHGSLRGFSKQVIRSYSLLLILMGSVLLSLLLALNSYQSHRSQVQAWITSLPKSVLPHLIDSDNFSVSSKLRLIESTHLFSCFEIRDRTESRIDGFGQGCESASPIAIEDVAGQRWGVYRYRENLLEPMLATLTFLIFSILGVSIIVLSWRGRMVTEFDRELGVLERICQELLKLSDELGEGRSLDAQSLERRLGSDRGMEEAANLGAAFGRFAQEIRKREGRIIELLDQKAAHDAQLGLSTLASQVAHDIRSPLAALDMTLREAEGLTGDTRTLVRAATQRIREIANGLLEQHRLARSGKAPENHPVPELLSGIIEQIALEKQVQYRDTLGLDVGVRIDKAARTAFAQIDASGLKRVLSNLLQNSIEALPNRRGTVRLELAMGEAPDSVRIHVIDNGVGIPEPVRRRLGERGFSHGKECSPEGSGSGMGIHHAYEQVASWGGQIAIASREGKGTEVAITLARVAAPSWFSRALEIRRDRPVVIVDDDASIHEIWKQRFAALDPAISLVHLRSERGIEDWVRQHGTDATFLMDQELGAESLAGLELVARLGLANQATLTTSSYEDSSVRSESERLGLRILPKHLASAVPIDVG